MGIEVAALAVSAAGVGLSAAGAASSASAQRRNIALQNQANAYQAATERYNARAQALSMHGQANLDDLSAQAEYHNTLMGAEFGRMQAGMEAFNLRNQAIYSAGRMRMQALEAEGSAALLEAGAELKEMQAQMALLSGERSEQDTRLKYARGKSSHTTRLAAGNIALDEGAALEVRTSYDVLSQREVLDIRRQATLTAWGHRIEGSMARARAGMQRSQAALLTGMAGLETAGADARARYVESTADTNARATRALAEAGLVSSRANTRYQRDMADITHENAMQGITTRETLSRNRSRGPSVGMAFGTALLQGVPSVLNSYQRYMLGQVKS